MAVMIEEMGRVDMLAVDARLEVQVLGSSTTRTTSQRNDITSLHTIANLDQILGVVTIIRLKTVGMLDAYQIAIAVVVA